MDGHGSPHAGKLGGKVALVTGGGQGIGRAISLALAGEGAHVVVVGRTLEKVKRVAEAIHRQHGQATPLSVDLTVKADVTRMVETVLAGPGRIDLLINNAAVMRRAPIVEMEGPDWDAVLEGNLKSMFLCSQAVARAMIQAKGGKIINVASNVGFLPRMGHAAYCASKAGVIIFSRVLALEMAPHHITVNVLCPGTTETEMIKGFLDKERIIQGDVKDFRTGIPLGRLATPEDHAKMVLFLCSEESNFITGQLFVVDGGQTMG